MATKPSLSARGCGFFGSSRTNNFCKPSKCFNDFLREESAEILTALAGTPATSGENSREAAATTRVGKSRCHVCKGKVGLLGFECRCGHVFCGTHRYAEEHSCPSDYRSAARDALAKNNPLIKADKLYKI
ncbi:PREDICTED: putative zinc finger A20 and AN1 domain-containing stress-associated protein 8 [Tarenaya hassleriana]|uniref:putative zinc finger A20 and AN1 domain-containing stress-associated protein 8 n=1 Tax=Tarenaya hassleriana TaxID=28532 RepID=UPI00053C14DE|nr:PREDICTED: putative zinc finger A20 and AN1 domain-containing stress-associated protein 8 [Tarenaya hassleriana]